MTARLPQAILAASAALLSFVTAGPLSAPLAAQTAVRRPQPRLVSPINDNARSTLPGSQPPRLRAAHDLGALDGGTALRSMSLVFSRSAAQQTDLDSLLAAQQDPSSPQFHQWLTPAQFGARFGMADSDLAKAEAWLQSEGFTVDSVAPSRDRIFFSGSAAAVSSAFGAALHRYTVDNESHFGPSADLTLPSAFSGVVQSVENLSDFRPRPRLRTGTVARPGFTSGQTGNHFLTPGDVAVIYDLKPAYSAGFNGSGQTIAVVGQSAITPADITSFQTAIGQTAKAPIALLVPNTGNSQHYTGDESETDLDLEYASAMAPGATVYLVYVGENQNSSVFDSLTYAVQNRLANIINVSYGSCEPALGQANYNTLNGVLAQAAAQGQTVVSASGDDGSSDCYGQSNASTAIQTSLAVDFPSSSPYVTSVGGTEFSTAAVASGNNTYFSAATGSSDAVTSALSYIPESVWNDNSATSGLSSGGGGASIFTTRPSWQTGVPGIPSGTARLVPDIALNASPNNASYAYCTSDNTAWSNGQIGSCTSGLRDSSSQNLTVAGGTSFAAPIFAGMLAVLNQARGYTSQGNVNATLYTLASNAATYASAFHDITSGNNACGIGGAFCSTASAASFSAGIGYDQATGLGSVDFNNLLSAWPKNTVTPAATPTISLTSTPLTVSQSLSSTAVVTATSTVTVTPANGYTGTIAWTVLPSATVVTGPTSSQSIACYSIPNTTVTGAGPVPVTLTITTGATACATGANPLIVPGTLSTHLHPLPGLSPGSPAGTALASSSSSPTAPQGRAAGSDATRRSPLQPAPAALAGLGLATLALAARRRSRRLPALLALALFASLGLGLSGCSSGITPITKGGGSSNTNTPTTTNYTVTVLGTDTSNSAITAKTTFSLTLNQQ